MNQSAGTVLSFAMAVSLLLGAVFVGYLAVLVTPLLRSRARPSGDAAALDWHVLVPCRDEEAVIGQTLARLRGLHPALHVWVIDDASVDGTARVIGAAAAEDPYVHLVQRVLPQARTGKGAALNAAYRALCEWLPGDAAPERVVVGVFDADGTPGPGCLDVISADHLFGDPEVAAVQIEVRMANREERRPLPHPYLVRNLLARTLVRMQDLEFRTAIPAVQLSRRMTRTVAMGGNGQFTRLSALKGIALQGGEGAADGPWGGSLLEDYELGLQLTLAGWRTAFTRDTWVDQEGLWNVRQLLAQRARWSQGAMQCMRYLPRIWDSRKLTTMGVLEITYCLLQPWLQLFGSVVFPALAVLLAVRFVRHPEAIGVFLSSGGYGLFLAYLVLSVVQFTIWGPLYWLKCERSAGLWRCLGWGVAYSCYIWLYCLCTWRAAGRFAKGRDGWVKTRRNAELRSAQV